MEVGEGQEAIKADFLCAPGYVVGKIYDENDKNLMIPLGDYVLKVIWARNGTSTE